MPDSRLQIRRVQAQYLVPSGHSAPSHLKDRLDNEFKRNLSHVLSNAFSSWFSETDSSLWFVKQLEIDLAVNASSRGEHVAKTFSRQLGRALNDTLQDCSDPGNVVRFVNHADYLAHFLADLAAGVAWGRWYYESFWGLRLVPASAALRTAVCNEPDTGKAALLLLRKNELHDVLRTLNQQDARLMLEIFTSGAGSDDSLESSEIAASVAQFADLNSLIEFDGWARALYLYLGVAREHEESKADLPAVLRASPVRIREVAEKLPLLQTTQNELLEITHRSTPFGGAFLLLPIIDELPLAEALATWPHADEAAAISLVRFLVLIKCGGHEVAKRTFSDPVIRDLMMIPPGVWVEVLNDWQSRVSETDVQNFLRVLQTWQCSNSSVERLAMLPQDLAHLALPNWLEFSPNVDLALSEAAQNVLRNFAWRLPGFAESNLPYLRTNFLDFPASIEEEITRRVVRLGSPPLRLVLSLTGMVRQTYRLSWMDDRPFVLFEE
jgi:hypothetical protein